MTNTKTSDLEGVALDWAVAKCEGVEVEYINDGITQCLLQKPSGRYAPSTDWAQCGPIIERGRIGIEPWGANRSWIAQTYNEAGRVTQRQYGSTPLIAAMRCYVSSKLGDEINLPKDLQL
jgi:hypothetical protein